MSKWTRAHIDKEDQIQKIIENAGAEYIGMHRASENDPYLVYFNAPKGATTLRLPISEITPENVVAALSGTPVSPKGPEPLTLDNFLMVTADDQLTFPLTPQVEEKKPEEPCHCCGTCKHLHFDEHGSFCQMSELVSEIHGPLKLDEWVENYVKEQEEPQCTIWEFLPGGHRLQRRPESLEGV